MGCGKITILKDTVQSGIWKIKNCESNIFMFLSTIRSLPAFTTSTLRVRSNALSIGMVDRTHDMKVYGSDIRVAALEVATTEGDGSDIRVAAVEVDVSDNGVVVTEVVFMEVVVTEPAVFEVVFLEVIDVLTLVLAARRLEFD